MAFLLDTHAFIWYAEGSKQLSERGRQIIAGPEVCYVSIVSIWEITIKTSLGKLILPEDVQSFVAKEFRVLDYRLLGIDLRHVYGMEKLPFYHRDPFDRMLISQSKSENFSIISADTIFDSYEVDRIW